MNRLQTIRAFGQRVWLDSLSRELLLSGELARLVKDDGIAGVTTNPTIFYNAVSTQPDYQRQLTRLKAHALDAESTYEQLVMPDVCAACDIMAPLYQQTNQEDGYVSLEVSPLLAQDTEGTLAAARRLWQQVDRPNLMIKIPATVAGIKAFRRLTCEGINVNITLLFSLSQVDAVWDAYIDGLTQRRHEGRALAPVKAVASFFLSRIDSQLDPVLPDECKGKVAIAVAKTVYQYYLERFHGLAFKKLQEAGAKPQFLLWASTATKNPAYSDVLYVESLIGPETINTVSPTTLENFRDHGHVSASLSADLEQALACLQQVEANGVSLTAVGQALQHEGLTLFTQSFTALLALMA